MMTDENAETAVAEIVRWYRRAPRIISFETLFLQRPEEAPASAEEFDRFVEVFDRGLPLSVLPSRFSCAACAVPRMTDAPPGVMKVIVPLEESIVVLNNQFFHQLNAHSAGLPLEIREVISALHGQSAQEIRVALGSLGIKNKVLGDELRQNQVRSRQSRFADVLSTTVSKPVPRVRADVSYEYSMLDSLDVGERGELDESFLRWLKEYNSVFVAGYGGESWLRCCNICRFPGKIGGGAARLPYLAISCGAQVLVINPLVVHLLCVHGIKVEDSLARFVEHHVSSGRSPNQAVQEYVSLLEDADVL